ncbi:MAG: hypothetical protein H7X77_04925 [Anaerolineae bacterium]|nr:hypothetical protein [Anaerolineae bacterium]
MPTICPPLPRRAVLHSFYNLFTSRNLRQTFAAFAARHCRVTIFEGNIRRSAENYFSRRRRQSKTRTLGRVFKKLLPGIGIN